ncbi:hypothetical protein TCDM_12256 [Trypanosoma cruzi Dm28c]|uniref:Uncharacterized protein n=1 Tax=Trypanosoma cruzi Dm28c TaxID=1416333 RepID=V5AW23_TRYCR|nr:hypothetical protein TCDM_12256 [Trypanosoma cruzi Dm28c]
MGNQKATRPLNHAQPPHSYKWQQQQKQKTHQKRQIGSARLQSSHNIPRVKGLSTKKKIKKMTNPGLRCACSSPQMCVHVLLRCKRIRVWDAFKETEVTNNAEHTSGHGKQTRQNTIIITLIYTSNHSRSVHIPVIECWHAQPAHTSLAHSGVHQRGYGEQQRGIHPRRAAEAAVDFAKT